LRGRRCTSRRRDHPPAEDLGRSRSSHRRLRITQAVTSHARRIRVRTALAASALVAAAGGCGSTGRSTSTSAASSRVQTDGPTPAAQAIPASHVGPWSPPVIEPKNFVSRVDNPYLPLVPGTTLRHQGVMKNGTAGHRQGPRKPRTDHRPVPDLQRHAADPGAVTAGARHQRPEVVSAGNRLRPGVCCERKPGADQARKRDPPLIWRAPTSRTDTHRRSPPVAEIT
jgi:hypothetical protein